MSIGNAIRTAVLRFLGACGGYWTGFLAEDPARLVYCVGLSWLLYFSGVQRTSINYRYIDPLETLF